MIYIMGVLFSQPPPPIWILNDRVTLNPLTTTCRHVINPAMLAFVHQDDNTIWKVIRGNLQPDGSISNTVLIAMEGTDDFPTAVYADNLLVFPPAPHAYVSPHGNPQAPLKKQPSLKF